MRGNQKNKNYKIKWTPKFAYAIGLLTTDGNLSKDGRHLSFTSKDIQLVKTFKNCLDLTSVKIGNKTSGATDKRYHRIQFSNSNLYKWLLKIGLMPNKSRKIGTMKIPNKYFLDFLRGCFDGDGSFYSYWDPRWKSSFMFYTTFCSGSLTFIRWLRKRIKQLINIKGHINANKLKAIWQLKFAKGESRELWQELYYSTEIPFLKRKYLKIKRAQMEELEDSHP